MSTATAPGPSSVASVNPAPTQGAMGLARVSYRHWPEAYCCRVGEVELTVVASMGPRILSLRLERGDNLLHQDRSDFGVGEWRLHGGHRFTTAPESPDSYLPDNTMCGVVTENGMLLIVQPTTSTGLEKTLRIKAASGGSGFEISHGLRNAGVQSWRGAPWAVTGCATPGRVVVPWGSGDGPSRTQMVRYLVSDGAVYADATNRQWRPAADHFVVQPAGQQGKISLNSDRAWLAWLRPQCTFVKHCPAFAPERDYLYGGCNVEVFVGPDYVELETLGALTTLAPGQELAHVEHWHLLRERFEPEEWPALEARLRHG